MGEYRAGQGPITSAAAAKLNMGRTSFLRVTHTGQRSNPTEYAVEKKIQQGEPSRLDMEILFQANPISVSTYREAKMSDREIYDILKRNL